MPLRDTLLRVAEKGMYQVRFSEEILEEVTRNLVKDRRMSNERASHLQAVIVEHFPEALIEIPSELVAAMTNDPKDRHVLAAAVRSKAEVIVTFNLKDFQVGALAPWGVEAQHPDTFLMNLCDMHGTEQLVQVIQEQVNELKHPIPVLDLLDKLKGQVPNFAAHVTTDLYGHEVRDIAKKCIGLLGKPERSGCRSYAGDYYNLQLIKGVLTVSAKDNRGEILRDESKTLVGQLLPEDIRRFQKIKEAIETLA